MRHHRLDGRAGSPVPAPGAARTPVVARTLGVALAVAACAACTKVKEQPVAPAPAELASATPVKKDRPPPPPPKWETLEPEEAKPPPPPVAAPARPDTLNGDPEGLRREDLQKTLDAALPNLASCFDGAAGSVNVSLSFDADPTGKAANIQIGGADPAAKSCLSARVAALPLPRFSGKPVPVHFPISVQRTTTAAAPAAQARPSQAAAAAQPPAIFVNP